MLLAASFFLTALLSGVFTSLAVGEHHSVDAGFAVFFGLLAVLNAIMYAKQS